MYIFCGRRSVQTCCFVSQVVTVASSSVSMMPSKCEVKLRKQGASSWSKLQVKTLEVATEETSETAREELSGSDVDEDSGTGEVDLSDL